MEIVSFSIIEFDSDLSTVKFISLLSRTKRFLTVSLPLFFFFPLASLCYKSWQMWIPRQLKRAYQNRHHKAINLGNLELFWTCLNHRSLQIGGRRHLRPNTRVPQRRWWSAKKIHSAHTAVLPTSPGTELIWEGKVDIVRWFPYKERCYLC